MIRTLDATLLNTVANDPAVRPFIDRAEGPVDLQPLLNNVDNVALVDEYGGFIFTRLEAGRYDLHTLFLPEGRGVHVLRAAAFAARFMFTSTDCAEIVTKVAASNPAADFMVRRCGFRPLFSRPQAWRDGSAMTYFCLTLDEWQQQDKTLIGEGHAFHQPIEDAKLAMGSALPVHPDDPAHERAAGLAYLMVRCGQVQKAVWSYNRWARLAGYQTVELLSAAPPVIDIRDAVVGLKDGALEVMLCR